MSTSRVAAPLRGISVAALLLAALLAVVGAPPAAAHARLLGSTPADGSTVHALPPTLELVFNEDVDPTLAQVVIEDSGGSTTSHDPKVRGPALDVPLPRDLPTGLVTVRYRVVSADSHPISGQIAFTYAGAQTPAAATGTPGPATAPPQAPSPQAVAADGPRTSSPMFSVLTAVAVLLVAGLAVLFLLWNRRHGR